MFSSFWQCSNYFRPWVSSWSNEQRAHHCACTRIRQLIFNISLIKQVFTVHMSCHVGHGSTSWRLKGRNIMNTVLVHLIQFTHTKLWGPPKISQWVKGFILLPKCGDLSLIAGTHIYIKGKNQVPELSCDFHTYAVTHTHTIVIHYSNSVEILI